MRSLKSTIKSLAFLLLVTPIALPAAQNSPDQSVEILPIEFSGDGLEGEGGDRLRAAIEDAQFVGLGEDHGLAGSPQLGEALMHEMLAIARRQDGGAIYHAVETGPASTRWFTEQMARGGLGAMRQGLVGRPWAMPFLTNVEDAQLAAPFAQQGRLWGIDQEFVGATTILLAQLSQRTTNAETRTLLAAWVDRDNVALRTGAFSDASMSSANAAAFTDLRSRFAGDDEALTIINDLADSARIYALNSSERYLQSNEERAALMIGYFLRAYNAAPEPAPRVLLKMGAFHLGRGTTPTSIYDLGSLLPGLAAANDRQFVNVAYIPISGTVRSIQPSPDQFTTVVPYPDSEIVPILEAAGIAIDAIPAEGHVLIPLRPLRYALQGAALRNLPTFARSLVIGFDYLVTTRAAMPATHFEAVPSE